MERKSGALLASSISGQKLYESYDPVSGTAKVVLAQQAGSEVIRGIAQAAVDPLAGWARFGSTVSEDLQIGDYYARAGGIAMQV